MSGIQTLYFSGDKHRLPRYIVVVNGSVAIVWQPVSSLVRQSDSPTAHLSDSPIAR